MRMPNARGAPRHRTSALPRGRRCRACIRSSARSGRRCHSPARMSSAMRSSWRAKSRMYPSTVSATGSLNAPGELQTRMPRRRAPATSIESMPVPHLANDSQPRRGIQDAAGDPVVAADHRVDVTDEGQQFVFFQPLDRLAQPPRHTRPPSSSSYRGITCTAPRGAVTRTLGWSRVTSRQVTPDHRAGRHQAATRSRSSGVSTAYVTNSVRTT